MKNNIWSPVSVIPTGFQSFCYMFFYTYFILTGLKIKNEKTQCNWCKSANSKVRWSKYKDVIEILNYLMFIKIVQKMQKNDANSLTIFLSGDRGSMFPAWLRGCILWGFYWILLNYINPTYWEADNENYECQPADDFPFCVQLIIKVKFRMGQMYQKSGY